uniref:Putative g-protein coupled receptor mth n=1 Tax=Ornithodoros turicata TaxID=34597 RepID=A0A2R5LLE8_9ACAR
MAINMFLDSVYLNWVQQHFQNITADGEMVPPLSSRDSANVVTVYLTRNPVLQLFQNNETWLTLLANTTDDDPSIPYRNATGNVAFEAGAGIRDYYPYIIAAMAVSLMFLSIICFVYCVLPELRSTHGKNLLSLSVCFMVLYVGFISDYAFRTMMPRELCLALAVVQHTTFLAVFFWTNVMAFDVWQAIVTLRPLANPRLREDRYWHYAAYAWTATIVVSAPALLFQFTDLVPVYYRPRFGETKCWLGGYLAYALYFNLPVGIILLCNVVIFVLTAWALYRAKATQKATLQAKQHKKIFHLYVKLSLVMGIIWVFEFIPWITGYYKLYGLAGMLNSLHGLYLFFIFVFKRKIWTQVRRRVVCCGKDAEPRSMSKKYSTTTLTSVSICTVSAEVP